MNMQQEVASRALWMDGVKPRWERLVPLTEGAVDVSSFCAPCVLAYVYSEEAGVERGEYGGFSWAFDNYGKEVSSRAFRSREALPYWREEIAARLARGTPSDVAHETPSESAMQAAVDA